MTHSLSYSVIRFQPDALTDEFANIGVVAASGDRTFDFRLEAKRVARVTRFFGQVDSKLVKQVLVQLQAELARLKLLASNREALALFSSLIKDREGLIRYSAARYVLADDVPSKLDELFLRYVRPGRDLNSPLAAE